MTEKTYDAFLSITENDGEEVKKIEFKNSNATKEDIEFFLKNVLNLFRIKLQ